MNSVIEPLVLDLVRWCASADRAYDEVLDAWRTSCPRLMVWEEAVAQGLLETRPAAAGLAVVVTPHGHRHLARAGAKPSPGRPTPPLAARSRALA